MVAVVAPIIISGVISIAPGKAYAITPATVTQKYDSKGKLYYETIYSNKDQDRVTRKEYEGTDGGWNITEEYRDRGGVFSKREGTYGKGKTYEKAKWGGRAGYGEFGDYSETFTETRESVSGKEKWDYSKPVSSPCWPLWNLASGPCVKYLVSNLFTLSFSGPVIIWFILPARFLTRRLFFPSAGRLWTQAPTV